MKGISESVIIFVLIFGILGIIYLFNSSNSPFLTEEFKGGISYSSFPQNENLDTYTGMMVGGNSNLDCKRVWGYNGLYCSPDTALSTMVDPFYNTSSSMTCEGSGMQKGSGNVCLSADQRRLLTTRGVNASTGEAQIG